VVRGYRRVIGGGCRAAGLAGRLVGIDALTDALIA